MRHYGFIFTALALGGISTALAQSSSSPPIVPFSQSVLGGNSDHTDGNSPGAAAYTVNMDALDSTRLLGVGDRLSYRVVEDQKPPIPLVVTDSGEVEVPLIGRVPALGKSCKQLALEIKALLEKSYFYRCNVIVGLDAVSDQPRGTIYLTGDVRTQGALSLPPRENLTVSQAILRAGGFSDFANPRKVKVIRRISDKATKTMIVDVSKVLNKGEISNDPVLMPDDVIIVPEKLINF